MPLTEQEYLDKQRFPLTNRQGLNLHDQKMIDAVNRDALREQQEAGNPLTPRQQQIYQELQQKAG